MPSVYNKPFVENKPAVFFATVMSTKDPLKLGRVQVSLRSLDKPVEMPWLRVLQAQASKGFGSYCLPEKGDVVAVLRGNGENVHGMIILGGLYDKKHSPPESDSNGKNDLKGFKSRSGNKVFLSDAKGETRINMVTAKGLSIKMEDKAKKVTVEAKSVVMTLDAKSKAFKVSSPDLVHIKGKQIVLDADKIILKGKEIQTDTKKLMLEGKEVNVKGESKASIAATKIAIKAGSACIIKGGSKIAIKAGTVAIN